MNQHRLNEFENVPYAFDLLGQCYEARNENEAALTCYKIATTINPSAASAWHNLGLFYTNSAKDCLNLDLEQSLALFHEAKLCLEKALNICSTQPIFLNSVASWYEKYIEVLEKLIEQQKKAVQENIDNHFKLAIQYYQEALTACREDDMALKNIITSNLTECLAQYGHYLYNAENFVEALEYYTQANQLDPEHLVVITQIGMSLFNQNRFPEAREHFSEIFEKTADHQEWADAWLNIACTYRLEKSWVNAENALHETKKFAPEDPSIHEEEQELMNSRLQASSITALHFMFSNLNIDSQPQSSTETEEKTSLNLTFP